MMNADAATMKRNPCIPPPDGSWTTSEKRIPGLGYRGDPYKNGAVRSGGGAHTLPPRCFRNAKNVSARVLLDWHPVVHLIDAHDLRIAAVGPELVVFAHDERLDRFGGTNLGAESAEAAARQIKVKIIEHFDLEARLAMAAEGDQIVRAGLRTLIADDARLRTGRDRKSVV